MRGGGALQVQYILTNLNSSVHKLRKKPVQIREFVQFSEPFNIVQSLVKYSNRTYTFDKIP